MYKHNCEPKKSSHIAIVHFLIKNLKKSIPFFLIVSFFLFPACILKKKDILDRIRDRGIITVLTRNNAHSYYLYRGEAMGFEYDLAKAFADYLGVELNVKLIEWEDMFRVLNKGKCDFIASSLAITPQREQVADFSDEYMSIQQQLIIHKNNYSITELEDLSGKAVHVRKGTSYEERLNEIQQGDLDLTIKTYDDMPTEQLIKWVAEEEIEMTVADTNIARLNRRYFPDIKTSIIISEPQSLAWAVKKGAETLLAAINEFFRITRANGTFDSIYTAYYGDEEVFDSFDVKKYHQIIETRLPKYEKIIKKTAEKYGFDWRLIAATIHQESHFNPLAKSHRGVRGLMQLTLVTAKELGISNRLDPEQSIMGGTKYLNNLYQRFDQAQGLDRILIALASYNVGARHVRNAQQIAREKGLDPNKWFSLEKTLPLLCQEKYVRKSGFGYCRGTEPVRFVNRILLYYDILKRKELGH